MKLTEKASYIKGIIDGLNVDESTKEGKVLIQMSELLSEMAASIEDMQDEVNDVTDLVEVIDQDLSDVEDSLSYDDEYDDEDDDEDEELDDDELYEVTCPSCGDTIYLTENMLEDGSIECPGCGENLEFDYDPNEIECECEDCIDDSEDKE